MFIDSFSLAVFHELYRLIILVEKRKKSVFVVSFLESLKFFMTAMLFYRMMTDFEAFCGIMVGKMLIHIVINFYNKHVSSN